eukprot:5809584-Pleurochrysis_carterae.AAC.1
MTTSLRSEKEDTRNQSMIVMLAANSVSAPARALRPNKASKTRALDMRCHWMIVVLATPRP